MGWVRYLLASIVMLGCGRISFDPLEPLVDEIGVEPAFPTSGGLWNEYVLPDGSVCPYTDDYHDQFYDSCIHAAERFVVPLPGETSCDDLEVSDELGAFKWKCRTEPMVTLYTRGLRPEAKLATLLEPDRWKPNRVIVRRNGDVIYASRPSAWWSNPVVPLPDNRDTNVAMLDQPSTVYTLAQSDWTVGYKVTANGVAIVTLGDAILSFSGTAQNCSVSTYNRCIVTTALALQRLWFEGSFSGGAPARADIGIHIDEAFFPVVRHVRTFQFTGDGLYLYYTSGALVDELVSTDNDGRGFNDQYGMYAIERDITVANNLGNGMRVFDGGPWRLTNLRAINNGGDGVLFSFAAIGVLSNVLAAHNAGTGVTWSVIDFPQAVTNRVLSIHNGVDGMLVSSMYDNALSHVVSLNNGDTGLELSSFGTQNRIAQIATAHNASYGLRSESFSMTTYTDNLLVGNNSIQDCIESAGTNPGIDNNCTSDANVSTGRDMTASFTGPTPRTATGQLVKDWFEPPLTVWGRDGSAMAPALRGRCNTPDTCRAWDYSLAAADTQLRNVSASEPFVSGATCPSGIHGDRAIRDNSGYCDYPSWVGSCGRTFLINAIEIDDDYVGNDDGLCESSEACLYAPSFGLDHGSGNNIGPCIFVDGLVSGVTMYARDN